MPKFEYRGMSLEQLQKLSLQEFSRLVTSRERRKINRGFTATDKKLLEDIRKSPKKFHRTHAREIIIVPQMIGAKLGVYNGKDYVTVEIIPEMLGHRLGEFAMTRKAVKHSAPGFGATKSSKFIPLK